MANFLGALDWNVGDDYIGARRGGRGRGGHGGHGGGHSAFGARRSAALSRANRAAQYAMPDMPGTPSMDAAILPASFPILSFTDADGVNFKSVEMNPQCGFRGQRLIATVIRNGTTALGTAPFVKQLQVGMKPIITTVNPVALEWYVASAFDTNLLMPPTQPGVTYQISVGLALALTTPDTVLVLAGIQGTAVL